MTLSQQTAQNREKFRDMQRLYDCRVFGFQLTYLDTLTEETWKAAQEEVLERVLDLIRGKQSVLWSDDIPEHARRIHRQNTLDEIRIAIEELTNNQPPV